MSKSRILVTGAGGFIGSHLTEKLFERGHNVRAFIRYNSQNKWGWLEKSPIKNNIEVVCGDIRDYDSVYSALKKCDQVFHLAALVGIPYSYESPLSYIQTNIIGTYNVLQASKELGLENIIITSTSETYGSAQYVPIDEKHPVVGQSPYSATKISADQLALSYFRSYKLPVKLIRPFNTYGPRQSARAIIPTIITQILSGQKEIKIGNLYPTRDFTYIKDTVRAFISISESPKLFGEITNIGMKSEISIGKLVKTIAELLNIDTQVAPANERIRPDGSEVNRLICDNSKLIKNTDWKPEYNLINGLLETIDWIKTNISEYKAELYNI
jgi:dTDP-glucose 4,6-dehydratase